MQRTFMSVVALCLLVSAAAQAQTVTIAPPAGQSAVTTDNIVTVSGSGWAASATVDSGFSATYVQFFDGATVIAQAAINTSQFAVNASGNLSGSFALPLADQSADTVKLTVSVNSSAQTATSAAIAVAQAPRLIAAHVSGNQLALSFDLAMADPDDDVAITAFAFSTGTGASTPDMDDVPNTAITLDAGDDMVLLIDMSMAAEPLVLNNNVRIAATGVLSADGVSAEQDSIPVVITESPSIVEAVYDVNTKELTVTFSLPVTVASVAASLDDLAVETDDGADSVVLEDATLTTTSNSTSMVLEFTRDIDAMVIALATRNLVYSGTGIEDTLGNAVLMTTGTDVPLSMIADDTDPEIVEIRQLQADLSMVAVVFDEFLDLTTSEDTDNYTLNGGGATLVSATLQADGMTVVLDFNATVSTSTNTLSISNVEDTSGNVMASAATQEILSEFDSDGTVIAGPLGDTPTLDSVSGAADFVSLFDFKLTDDGTTDGAAMLVTEIVIDMAGSGDPEDLAWRLNGPNVTNATGVATATTITFSGLSISVSDGALQTFVLSGQIDSTPAATDDQDTFMFSLDRDGITVAQGGTLMTDGAGDAVAAIATYSVTPTALSVATQPAGATAGATFTTQPVVRMVDVYGNVDMSNDASTVTAAIQSGTGSFHVSSTNPVTVTDGVATFTNLRIDTSGAKTLRFSTNAGAYTVDSSSLTVSPAAAADIIVATEPSDAAGGDVFDTQPIIHVVDAYDNVVTSDDTTTIAVAILNNPSGGTLSGTTSGVLVTDGVATFTNLSIDEIGDDYTLRFTSTPQGYTADSAAFDITPGPAADLSITTHPAGATGGSVFSTQPVIQLVDAGGNNASTDSSATVTVSIFTDPSGGTAQLSGTTTKTATNGVVTFTDLKINTAASGYVLRFTLNGVGATDNSNAFDVTVGAATALAIATQPSGAVAGSVFTTQPVVRLTDAGGNTVTTDNATVITATIQTDPGSGGSTLSGTAAKTATSGLGIYTNLAINRTGTGFVLRFTANPGSGDITVDSSAFTVTPGALASLSVATQPAGARGAAVFSTQPIIHLLDGQGNIVTTETGTDVTVAIQTNPGSGTLATTLTVDANAGIATFTDLKINKVGTGYILRFSVNAGALTVDSSAFNVTPGTATKLYVDTQPAGAFGAEPFDTPAVVQLRDAGDNVLTNDDTSTVTVAIDDDPTSGDAQLGGTTTVTVTDGVATFSDLSIDLVGENYSLVFSTSAGAFTKTSDNFDVEPGTPTSIRIAVQPDGAVGGEAFTSQPMIEVLDAGGNLCTNNDTVEITASLAPSSTAGTLIGTTDMLVTDGVALFTDLAINEADAGFVIRFSADFGDDEDSDSFNVDPGEPSALVIQLQPAGAKGGTAFTTQPRIQVVDAGGNIVTTDDGTDITATIEDNPGPGTLSGTATIQTSGGIAQFTNLKIDKAATGYSLLFTYDGDLSLDIESGSFNVTVGTAAKLSVTTQPAGARGGIAFTTQPQVAIQDAGGNTVTADNSSNISVVIGDNPSSGTLTDSHGAVTVTSGVATFAGLSINKTGEDYSLNFSKGALTVESSGFDVTPGIFDAIAVATQPASASAGAVFGVQPVIHLLDTEGNLITTDSDTEVTVEIFTNPGSADLLGTDTVQAVEGVCTFTDLAISIADEGYVLRFTDSEEGFTVDTDAFDVVPGVPVGIEVFMQPAGAFGGSVFAITPVVHVVDEAGNTVSTDDTTEITVSLGSAPGAGVLSGTLMLTVTDGVAEFDDLEIDLIGDGYVLHFVSDDETPFEVDSDAFDVELGPAASLVVTTQPAGAVANIALSTQPIIEVRDAGGNKVTTDASTITAAIKTGTGTLTGDVDIAVANGVATFTDLELDTAQDGVVLSFTSSHGTPLSVDSSSFDVEAVGAYFGLAIATQPAGATGGEAFTTQPVIHLVDAAGTKVTNADRAVTASILSGPAGTLSGTATVTAVSGVVTFTNLKINLAGDNYILKFATASDAETISSSAFSVTVGSAAQLAITTQPSGAAGGSVFTTQPVVEVRDAGGNTLTSDDTTVVTASIYTGTQGATLSGTLTQTATDGVATFTDLKLDKSGSGYRLQFSLSNGALANSSTFTVSVGAAAGLLVTQEPVAIGANVAFSTPVAVAVVDAGGNTVTTDSSTIITASIGTDPGTGTTLGGDVEKTVASGTVTFTDLTLSVGGSGFTLAFLSSPGDFEAETEPFDVPLGAKLVEIAFDDRDNDDALSGGDVLYLTFDEELDPATVPTDNDANELDDAFVLSAGSYGTDATATLDESVLAIVIGTNESVSIAATIDPADSVHNLDGEQDGTPEPVAIPDASSDTFAPTVELTADFLDPAMVPPGVVTIFALFTDDQVGTPTISITTPGTDDVVAANMTQGVDARSWEYAFTVTAHNGTEYIDGEVLVVVTGDPQDGQDNAFLAHDEAIFITDTAGPTFTSLVATSGDLYRAGETITLQATLGVAGLEPTANLSVVDTAMSNVAAFVDAGGGIYTLTSSALAAGTLVEGEGIAIVVRVADAAGNISTESVEVTIDNTPPTVTLSYSQPTNSVGSGTLRIIATLNEDTTTLPSITVDGLGGGADVDDEDMEGNVPGSVFSYDLTIPAGTSGDATVSIDGATDEAGNEATSADNDEFTVVDNVATVEANAGSDQSIDSPQRVTLDGTASKGTSALTYQWSQVSGPTITLIAAGTSRPYFFAQKAGEYAFKVTVTSNLVSGSDTVSVTLENSAPTVDAGERVTLAATEVSSGFATLGLKAMAVDPNDDDLSASWSIISAPTSGNLSITTSDALASTLTVTGANITGGVYVFEVEVSDDSGATASDTVQFVVVSATASPPAAHAGLDRNIPLGDTVQLSANESVDTDGDIDEYAWSIVSAPTGSTADLVSASTAAPFFTPDLAGRYEIGLVITDDDGFVSAQDTVVVTAIDETSVSKNLPPRAKVTLRITNDGTGTGAGTMNVGETVSLDASESQDADADDEVTVTWEQTAGPAPLSINDAHATSITVALTDAGEYVLKVTPNDGTVDGIPAEVRFAVAEAGKAAPKAVAGIASSDDDDGDGYVTYIPGMGVEGQLSNDTVDLISTGSTGSGLSYQWRQLLGPTVGLMDASSASASFIPEKSRVYIFELTVTDSDGVSARATVSVAINTYDAALNPTGNAVPVADAGDERNKVRVGKSMMLSGSASDANDTSGLIVTWVQVDGPPVVIDDSDPNNVSFTPPIKATYVFEMYVDDGADISLPSLASFNVTSSGGGGGGGTDEGGTFDFIGCQVGTDGGVSLVVWLAVVMALGVWLRRRQKML